MLKDNYLSVETSYLDNEIGLTAECIVVQRSTWSVLEYLPMDD